MEATAVKKPYTAVTFYVFTSASVTDETQSTVLTFCDFGRGKCIATK